MAHALRIGLIGDYDSAVTAHQAIPLALALAESESGLPLELEWLPTDGITSDRSLQRMDGLWCVPASPYRSMDGALRAIRFARETPRPFLGTCGGFQHALIEYARSVLGWQDADHAETSPGAGRAVVSPLACALVEATDTVRFTPGSRLAEAYGRLEAQEGYRCRYGMNPGFADALTAGPLRRTAADATGETRGVELDGHPFFVATLFQPERAALSGVLPPLVRSFVRAVAAQAWVSSPSSTDS
jgi:CTP synthase (UTP-ammonia lyase)